MSIRITDLNPVVGDLCLKLLAKAAESGIKLRVVQGLRTMEEQAALYAKGRTRPGEPCRHWAVFRSPGTCKQHPFGLPVTNARPGSSPHNYGLAFDVAFETGVGLISWSGPWETVGSMGEKLGLHWGGHFTHLVDEPHFEAPNWRSLIPKAA